MNNPKNVQIPYDDFLRLLDIMQYIDISKYDYSLQCEFELIHDALKEKKKRLEARESYTALVVANKNQNDEAAHAARMDYLQKRKD